MTQTPLKCFNHSCPTEGTERPGGHPVSLCPPRVSIIHARRRVLKVPELTGKEVRGMCFNHSCPTEGTESTWKPSASNTGWIRFNHSCPTEGTESQSFRGEDAYFDSRFQSFMPDGGY